MRNFHNHKTIKSRKQRRCRCTGAIIESGSEYVRFSGVHDGEFYSEAVHPVAAPIYDRHCDQAWSNRDEGLSFDDLLESVMNLHDDQSKAERQLIAALPGAPEWFLEAVKREAGE